MKLKTVILTLAVVMMMTCFAVPSVASAATTENNSLIRTTDRVNKIVSEDETTKEETTKAPTKTALKTPVIKKTIRGTRVVELDWKSVKGAKKYKVYRKVGSKLVYVKTKKSSKTTVKNLTRGKTYNFVVKAIPSNTKANKVSQDTIKVKMPKKLTWRTKGFSKTNAYKVMRVAKSKVGCSYVSGGSGPYAFDCSGYAYYVNKKAGVSGKYFSRSTAQGERNALRKYSIGRSYKNAQPGDLVFIGSGSYITHVAYYYGDGKLIHATNPSVGVAITSIYWSGGPSKVVDIVRLPNM